MLKRLAMIAVVLSAWNVGYAEELPAYYAQYRYQAGLASDYVTSATDQVRFFTSPERYADLLTSEGLRMEYRERINTLQNAITIVQSDLLSTATTVYNAAAQELQAIEAMSKFREGQSE